MSLTLELPDDIGTRLLQNSDAAEREVRRELAIALYREGKLPPGRAAVVAGMERWEFDALLVERQVPYPRSDESFIEEIENALRRC